MAEGGGLAPSTQLILDAASECLWSDELQASLDTFSTNHAEMFADAPPDATEGGEQRLEWTQAHLDFQQLFEFQLEQFVATQPFTPEEFLAACQVMMPAACCRCPCPGRAGRRLAVLAGSLSLREPQTASGHQTAGCHQTASCRHQPNVTTCPTLTTDRCCCVHTTGCVGQRLMGQLQGPRGGGPLHGNVRILCQDDDRCG